MREWPPARLFLYAAEVGLLAVLAAGWVMLVALWTVTV